MRSLRHCESNVCTMALGFSSSSWVWFFNFENLLYLVFPSRKNCTMTHSTSSWPIYNCHKLSWNCSSVCFLIGKLELLTNSVIRCHFCTALFCLQYGKEGVARIGQGIIIRPLLIIYGQSTGWLLEISHISISIISFQNQIFNKSGKIELKRKMVEVDGLMIKNKGIKKYERFRKANFDYIRFLLKSSNSLEQWINWK